MRCFSAADALRATIGRAARPFDEATRTADVAQARDLLGKETFEQHWTEAANLPLGEMIEYVSRACGERKRPSSGWESLTSTERRVVGLAASGLTSIATSSATSEVCLAQTGTR